MSEEPEAALPEMDSLLECAICLGEFIDPRTLPCLHTYCLRCLHDHVRATATTGRFHCPACRKACSVPTKGVGDFPKNFFVNTMLSSIAAQKKKKKKKKKSTSSGPVSTTGVCANSEASEVHQTPVGYCDECEEYLCEECVEGHRRYKATRRHIVSSLADLSESSDDDNEDENHEGPRCQVHNEQLLALFCLRCNKAICFQCLDGEHADHRCIELADAEAETRSKLQQMDQSLSSRGAEYDNIIREIQQKKDAHTESTGQAREELDTSMRLIFHLLKEKRRTLKEAFDQQAAETFTKISASVEEMRMAKVKSESLRAHIRKAFTDTTDVVALVEKAPAILALEKDIPIPALPKESCLFQVKKKNTSSSVLDQLVGSLSIEQTTPLDIPQATTEEPGPGLEHLPATFPLLDTINVTARVTGMDVANGKVYMVHEGISGITLYDTFQRRFYALNIQGLKVLRTLTITEDGSSLLVTEGQTRYDYMVTRAVLAILEKSGGLIGHSLVTLSGIVTGVSTCSHKDLLVTSIHPKQVTIYRVNTHGSTKLKCGDVISLSEDHFSTDINAVPSGENFAILDSQKRRVTWVDKSGAALRRLMLCKLTTSAQLPPCYITPYGRHYMLITDSTKCTVTVVNHDRSIVTTILSQQNALYNPHVTHWDAGREELYVAQVDVHFRPPYTGGSGTPLINVYGLPALRGTQPRAQPSAPVEPVSERNVTLTLPNLVNSQHSSDSAV